MALPNITILGAGLIGASWTALFAHYGAEVSVWDPALDALDSLQHRLQDPFTHLAEIAPRTEPIGEIRLCSDLQDAVSRAALIQENAPEDVAIKHALYSEVESAAPADAILASSTSALTFSDLAPGLSRPERLITAHPFNPPHLVPLVETFGVDPIRLDSAELIYRQAGRVPVRLKKDATGHIANRLASALWREAVHIVAEGIADVKAVDQALVQGPGMRWSVMGAHMAYHLGGGAGGLEGYLRHLGPSQMRRWADLGAPDLSPQLCEDLVNGIADEVAGRTFDDLALARDAALIQALKSRSPL